MEEKRSRMQPSAREHRRLSSFEVFQSDLSNWTETHPLSPVLPLFLRLFSYLIVSGVQWMIRVWMMFVFITALTPAWYHGLKYYLGSQDVIRNVKFGHMPRNLLDIYLPPRHYTGKRPVAVFITGGIWIIGYKAWGMFVGKVVSAFGIVTVVPDYRNFPQGIIPDMIDDLDRALDWVMANVEDYQGDVDHIFLMGQSAGAHLGLLLLLKKAEKEVLVSEKALPKPETESSVLRGHRLRWSTTDIKAFLGIAGPYNICDLEPYFEKRGLSSKILRALVGGKEHLKGVSIDYVIKDLAENPSIIKRIPTVVLFHGTADLCVPYQESHKTGSALAKAGVQTYLKYHKGKSHTDAVIEDLVYAEEYCKEDVMTDIVKIILAQELAHEVIPSVAHRIVPQKGSREKLPQTPKMTNVLIHNPSINGGEAMVNGIMPTDKTNNHDCKGGSSEDDLMDDDSGKMPRRRPSFLAPKTETLEDSDINEIRRSAIPWICWKIARVFNPF